MLCDEDVSRFAEEELLDAEDAYTGLGICIPRGDEGALALLLLPLLSIALSTQMTSAGCGVKNGRSAIRSYFSVWSLCCS